MRLEIRGIILLAIVLHGVFILWILPPCLSIAGARESEHVLRDPKNLINASPQAFTNSSVAYISSLKVTATIPNFSVAVDQTGHAENHAGTATDREDTAADRDGSGAERVGRPTDH